MKRFNEDYWNGINLFLKECRKIGIDGRKYKWVTFLSKELSKDNLCYLFWENCINQQRLLRIKECKTFNDIFHGVGHSLFFWGETQQGFGTWKKFESNLKKKYHISSDAMLYIYE